jgi:hypothetical protein
MWQALAAHSRQRFHADAELASRASDLEQALSELCFAIARETGDATKGGLQRALALRSRPAAGGKSHYECINQLIHYWYCCAAARHLLSMGFPEIVMRPTGHDNAADGEEDAFDLDGTHPQLGRLVGEVFCVSEALWDSKMGKTRRKLEDSDAPIRAAFYNVEAKPKYRPKMKRLTVLGIESPSGVVREIASTGD